MIEQDTFRAGLNSLKHILDFGPIATRRLHRAQRHISETKINDLIVDDGRYLDIGCGKGYIRWQLEEQNTRRGIRVFGCDIKDYPTRRARKNSTSTFMFADGKFLPFSDASFDGVLMFFVLHHVAREDQEGLLKEAKRMLRPGGYIFVAEDTVESGEQRKRTLQADQRFNPDFGKPSPHEYRSSYEWKEEYRRLGLSVVREYRYNSGKVEHGFYVLTEVLTYN